MGSHAKADAEEAARQEAAGEDLEEEGQRGKQARTSRKKPSSIPEAGWVLGRTQ